MWWLLGHFATATNGDRDKGRCTLKFKQRDVKSFDSYDASAEENSQPDRNGTISIECGKYLHENRIALTACSQEMLTWWKENCERFPVLSQVALKFLCISTTSASSERTFSSAGLSVSKLRLRLSGKHVNEINFLHCNSFIIKLGHLAAVWPLCVFSMCWMPLKKISKCNMHAYWTSLCMSYIRDIPISLYRSCVVKYSESESEANGIPICTHNGHPYSRLFNQS